MAEREGKGATLTSATQTLITTVNELGEVLGCPHEPTSEEEQLALPTPAEQSVFVTTTRILQVASRLLEIREALTSLLGAIGD